MTDTPQLAAEVAAIFEQYTLRLRESALAETRKRRITMIRQVGDGAQITHEMVIDEEATSEEVYHSLATIDGAIDRLKAKADLSGFYMSMLNKCGEIDLAVKRMAEDQVKFEAENAARNANRRVAVTMTSQQRETIDRSRVAIRDAFQRIEELQKAVAECCRIIGGEDPFLVLEQQIKSRVEALRGTRGAVAA